MDWPTLGLRLNSYTACAIPRSRRAQASLIRSSPACSDRRPRQGAGGDVVVPAGTVEAHALAKAKLLAQRAPAAVQATKRLLRRAEAASVTETIDVELTEFFARLQSLESREAMQAFLEKRTPKF